MFLRHFVTFILPNWYPLSILRSPDLHSTGAKDLQRSQNVGCYLYKISWKPSAWRSLFPRTDKWKLSHTKGFTGFLCADNTKLSVVFGGGKQCSRVFWISKKILLVTNSCWPYRQWIMDLMKGCIYLRTGTEEGYQRLHMSADFSTSLRTMKT